MHIHILGIGGTFMGSLAQLAKDSGHRVTGTDAKVYPPMSTQLASAGIEIIEGFDPGQLRLAPDMIVVGNVVSRGNPLMEAVLNSHIPYISGPQWMAEHILRRRWVLAVAGTHGKTTTATMLAWIMEYAGMAPGYLIGGVPANFERSARLGETDFFVIEADEYDTAFFDKRSKFLHYRPRTLVINNLEFDHADIFPDLHAIQTQFHHLIRTVPGQGLIIRAAEPAIDEVLQRGCWSEVQTLGEGGDWRSQNHDSGDGQFEVCLRGDRAGRVRWDLVGGHNIHNAVAAIAAARHVGVDPALACEALGHFRGVKRRMELLGEVGLCKVYDDFAHHPTAIASTLDGLRSKVGEERIIAIIEPRSNTMRRGVHREVLLPSVQAADQVYWYYSDSLAWSPERYLDYCAESVGHSKLRLSKVLASTEAIIAGVAERKVDRPTHIVIMSNGGFEGIHQRLLAALENKA